MNIDLEILLREAFVAGFEFRTLKKDGGKGIDCDKWLELKGEVVKNLTIPDVIVPKGTVCGCGRPYSQKDLQDGMCNKCCAPTR